MNESTPSAGERIYALKHRFGEEMLDFKVPKNYFRTDTTPPWSVFSRLIYIIMIDSGGMTTPLQRANHRKLTAVYGVYAYPHLAELERKQFAEHFVQLPSDQKEVILDPLEHIMLAHLSSVADLAILTENVPIPVPQELCKRKSVGTSTDTKIPHLSQRRLVETLVALSTPDFEAFKKARAKKTLETIETISANKDDMTDRERARFILSAKDIPPLYEVEAECRRMWVDYRLWDDEIDESPQFQPNDELPRRRLGKLLSYEEAVEIQRRSYLADFYRDFLLPIAQKGEVNPTRIPVERLGNLFYQYKDFIGLKGKPGTDITIKDLQDFIGDIRTQTSDENIRRLCDVIYTAAKIILEVEGSLSS